VGVSLFGCFLNIKIAQKKIFSFSFFAPFNFLFFEQENFYKCQQNQRLLPKKKPSVYIRTFG